LEFAQEINMATISSAGIGSGLDVKSIVSQLVALEKQPLVKLQSKADVVKAQVSAFGQIKSMVSALSGAVGALASVTGWNAVTATSSDIAAVSVSAIGGASPTAFNVGVTALAKAKATTSAGITPSGDPAGAGTLKVTLANGSYVDIVVSDTDTVGNIASTINGSASGVTATVLTDASGDRLMLRSTSTGLESAFALSVASDADGNAADALGLSRLVVGSTTTQEAADAVATVNGVTVSSASNTFENTVAGVTFTALKVTSSPAEISIAKDLSNVKSKIEAFVKAYNEINLVINDATKYDAGTKTAGLLQGDSTVLGLQSALRGILQSGTSGGTFSRLADVGISQQLGGSLTVDASKLDAALLKPDDLKNLFRASTGNVLTDGVATKLQAFSTGLMAATGFFSTKETSLQKALDRNSLDQTKVTERATRVEAQLNRRYSALDAQMASLTALNAYVAQQVTTWNKSTA
jgi:flagellar hook-associated protein 2